MLLLKQPKEATAEKYALFYKKIGLKPGYEQEQLKRNTKLRQV